MNILYGKQFKIKNKAERSAVFFKAHYSSENNQKTVTNSYYQLIIKSAACNKTWAIYTLAYMYEHGIYVQRDLKIAFSWYKKGAILGDDICQLELFYFYEYGMLGEVNSYLAIFWLKQAAESGNIIAQFKLASVFLEGKVEKPNAEEAKYWLTQAALSGHSSSMWLLGELYNNDKNYLSAYKWYLKAAKLGHSDARLDLAKLVFKHFTNKDKYVLKAISYLKKLVKARNEEALYLLGKYYKDNEMFESAFALLNEAAQTYKNKAAIYEVGDMYENGLGVQKDYDKAIELFSKLI